MGGSMKKFKFQLETLLKVTTMERDKKQVELAEAAHKVEEEREKLAQYLAEMQKGQQDFDELTQKGKIKVNTVIMYTNFFNYKRLQIEQQQKAILQAENERKQKLKELVDVTNKLKSIEQLKEKRRQEYFQEMMAEEQKILDELGGQLYFRKAK